MAILMTSIQYHLQEGVSIAAPKSKQHADILSPAALEFVVKLEREFGERRRGLLKKRQERQNEFVIGKIPVVAPETEQIRTSYWKTSPIPYPLLDRRVELVGPPVEKTIVEALNSEANVFVADFEDTFSPHWDNVIRGHSNVHDAVHGSLLYTDDDGNQHAITQNSVTMMLRPRGWHSVEKHFLVDSKPVSASLFDFGLFVFHNTQELRNQGKGPYCYLPKLENHLEAKLWNDVFLMAQDELKVPHGTVKATVSIETLTAAFEINEILYELREHCVGLQCNWWNYIFNFMNKLRHLSEYSIPDVSRLSTTTFFLHALSLLTIQAAHKRGVHALAGPSIQYPLTPDSAHNEALLIKIRVDKSREAEEGFDGTWILHPAVIATARRAFDEVLNGPNQLHRKRDDMVVTENDLLAVHRGERQYLDIQSMIRSQLEFLAAWLSGRGMVIQKDLIITSTEAEIARTQLWQWNHSPKSRRTEGQRLNDDSYKKIAGEELKRLLAVETRKDMPAYYTAAKSLLDRLVTENTFIDFFSTLAYHHLE